MLQITSAKKYQNGIQVFWTDEEKNFLIFSRTKK